MKYSEDILFVIFKNSVTDESFAISRSNAVEIDKLYSDRDHLYAPDHLFVDGLLVSWDSSNGMLNIDDEHKTILKVKYLIPAWMTISK